MWLASASLILVRCQKATPLTQFQAGFMQQGVASIRKMYSKDTSTCHLHLLQLDTPIGPINVAGCEKGIHEIKLTPSDIVPCGKVRTVTVIGDERRSELPQPLHSCLRWLKMFFNDAGSIVDIPLPQLHTNIKQDTFISNVLDTLAHDIPVGETISYGGLAAKVGKPSACRAVGMAMRMNQVPLIVPCHRVVKSDGSLGNYMSGRGVALKRWLLNHEGVSLKD